MTLSFIKNNSSGYLKAIRHVLTRKKIVEETPLRAELFSIDQFTVHAKHLAQSHVVSFKRCPEKLLIRLKENKQILLQTYEMLNTAGNAKRKISPAGDWLLDNYYLIEEQISLAISFLPKTYSCELPNLIKGPMSGFPRVYDIAMEIVSHGDARLDIKGITEFAAAYQFVQHLKLGELWAIPIMLRLSLIENLRRVSSRMMLSQMDRDRADYWANRILSASAGSTDGVVIEIAAMAKEARPLSNSFVAEFVRCLHGQSSTSSLPLTWLDKKLSERGETITRMLQSSSQKQAADQVSFANTISSLRFLEMTNWHDFVEELSIVEKYLILDPSGDYPKMTFATRDRYRHIIEGLAIRSGLEEEEVAAKVLQIAGEAKKVKDGQPVSSHIGYYLIDKGIEPLCRVLKIRLHLSEYLHYKKNILFLLLYLGSVFFITAVFSSLFLLLAEKLGMSSWGGLVLLSFPLLLVTSQTALALVNWMTTLLVHPVKLPDMDFSGGIPACAHTLVVVPTLLSNKATVEILVENMEVRYLANTDINLNFALLTDFPDAGSEIMPEDESLLTLVKGRIEKLNQKYQRNKENIFYLFHRPRKWNEQEKVWMGYERKRGKLSELNALLRGAGPDCFSVILGDIARLQDVKYIITLDSDTKMPRDAAKELVGKIHHPLNRAVFDGQKQRVVSGYGILQPRVDVSYPGNNPSLFVRVFQGDFGIDPYTKTVSDVYQDLFREGSFIGKGIYDVDAFEKALEGRFPCNLILSHDLIEGCYARSALVTDVQFYEQYPSGYLKDVLRRHRWIRGDWQIYRWLFPVVLRQDNQREKNPLSLLSRWKILDNLRRSLVSASTVVLFLSGGFFLNSSGLWSMMIILLIGLPIPLTSLVALIRKFGDISIKAHLNSVFSSVCTQVIQFSLSLIFLLYEACFTLDAILTTFWRMFVSHKGLLEWRISGESDAGTPGSTVEYFKKMWISPLSVLILLICCVSMGGKMDPVGWVLSGLWFICPGVACFISMIFVPEKVMLPEAKVVFLRNLSRKIWNFFDTFVNGNDNWLPPDNFQEEYIHEVAHRTSPTNIGLSLLSTLTAYDFGYVSMGTLFDKTEKTIAVLLKMEKFRNHLYNWYDTESLTPLKPLYVSTVDSGNFAGHLHVFRSGIEEMRTAGIVSLKIFEGLLDTLNVLTEMTGGTKNNKNTAVSGDVLKIVNRLESFRVRLKDAPVCLSGIHALLRQLSIDISKMFSGFNHKNRDKIKKWIRLFEKQCYDHLEDMIYIAPWISLPPEIPGMWEKNNEKQNIRLEKLHAEFTLIDEIPVLKKVAGLELKLIPLIDEVLAGHVLMHPDSHREKEWFEQLRNAIRVAGTRAGDRLSAMEEISRHCTELFEMDFEFLYNKTSKLFTIGYNVSERKADPACYDLLASEARLCSFVAIAQGRVPQEHWFMLGRLLSKYGKDPVLVSWGGSMFEYLMPLLVMPTYEETLLDRTYKSVIERQMEYASKNNIPWGISESGYSKINSSMSYQYHSFGVPDIGFKRGLSEDLVVSPYSSVMALMVEPEKACKNLEFLSSQGFESDYGFYEAIDYTPSRLAPEETNAVVKSYMAHHQGMSLLSIAYLLLDRPMQKRFLADPMFRATEFLLQERVPKEVPFLYDVSVTGLLRNIEEREALMRVFQDPDTPTPETHILSNGKLCVMVTNSGGGYSRWKNIALTRWNEDSQLDDKGMFIYLRDMSSGEFWSAAYQPALKKSKKYEAIFSRSRAEYKRKDHDIETYTEIAVSPEDDIELRRVRITNKSRHKRIIEITSFAEVVLNTPADDRAHKSFSNLFIQTEIIRNYQAILCSRRSGDPEKKFPLMLHLMAVHGKAVVSASYETDRSRFIGRGNTPAHPYAMKNSNALSDSEGSVLDPIMAIRSRIEIEPYESAIIDYVIGVCEHRDAAFLMMEKYRDRELADRVFDLSWTSGQVGLQQINASEADAQLYGRLAGAIHYMNPAWRAGESIIRKNTRGQSDLWGYGISGDLPIVLLRIEFQENIELVEQVLKAYMYWRMKGLSVDLVIFNEDSSVYRDLMSERINALIASHEEMLSNRPGGIFLRRADQMSEEDKILLKTIARIILSDRGGSLAEQIEYRGKTAVLVPPFIPSKKIENVKNVKDPDERSNLVFFNGTGGFTPDGREYVITTNASQRTPAPWVNVIANPWFGTVISESGSAYTWSENAHEFRLTPWKNDPVSDLSGEALYLRDEETGHFWSPTPLPACGEGNYVSRHGFGYSVFEHMENGIRSELTVFVSLDCPVKFSLLKVRNLSGSRKIISASSYCELVLGTFREESHMHILSEVDTKSSALLAWNHYNKEFSNKVIFLNGSEPDNCVSGDRKEFLGRNGTMENPSVMHQEKLSGKTGAGMDPCASMQLKFELEDQYEKEIVFVFGAGNSLEDARNLIQRFNGVVPAQRELEKVWEYWKHALGVIYVETPDESLNFLVNGWLQYQTISARLWGKSGYYQSGGAYGFRDQLQDSLALIHSNPGMIRENLLLFASRQFKDGDVQHWWHPPAGRGVRTRCSDDYLWLPYVTCQYVEAIGDTGVLEEPVDFLGGPQVNPGEESNYFMPKTLGQPQSLYEHCVLAVKKALNFGVHGLPLMGTGDWNDGMNRTGFEGRGESVWLAFFLCSVLKSMAGLAARKGDREFSESCGFEASKLSRNIEENAWDGQWYKRAYHDNGEALGSSSNPECSIDSLPQSWAVLSGSADIQRARTALENVDQHLVDRKNRLIKLFTPPFDKSVSNPGYIKGYVPGVRENGGQYTHAAVWVVTAFALLKDSARVWELFDLINPIHHADTKDKCSTYKVDPYVMPADIYAGEPNAGRGGWTWYTGSASWMYQLIVRHLLGIQLEIDRLYFDPCLPKEWKEFKIHYRYRNTFYHITLIRPEGSDKVRSVIVDGTVQTGKSISLMDDGKEHLVEVTTGEEKTEECG